MMIYVLVGKEFWHGRRHLIDFHKSRARSNPIRQCVHQSVRPRPSTPVHPVHPRPSNHLNGQTGLGSPSAVRPSVRQTDEHTAIHCTRTTEVDVVFELSHINTHTSNSFNIPDLCR